MALNDLSHLPRAEKPQAEGLAPDAEPRFVQLLVERWAETADNDKPRAFDDTRFRHSDAGKCARAVAYAALDLPSTNPMDLSGTWNTRLGTLIHEAWQEALAAKYPNADIEPKVRIGQGSGHIDATVHEDDKTTVVELKTIGGFAFKMAVGERGAAQGPKSEHIIQAALNGAAVDADEVVIAYLSKEAISVNVAQRKGFDEIGRFCAEWTFTREQYEPIANEEIKRVTGILDLLDEGTLPKRTIPGGELPPGHEITDPRTGQWRVERNGQVTDVGTWWACGYCRFQDLCVKTSPGRIPVSTVTVREEVA